MFDANTVRRDFRILKSGIIYLDSASSSLTPEPVLLKMLEFYREYRSNVGRSGYSISRRATEEYEQARQKVAHFINAKSKREIIMTRNATEGMNFVANGLKWDKKDKIVTTLVEHHSNFIVWLRIRQRFGLNVEVVNPKEPIESGILDPTEFEKIVDDKTKLVSITHISNALGTIEPIEEIIKIAHEHGAYVLIDAAQSVPHIKVDVQKKDCDFLVFSGHKMCAPTGSGVLYIRQELFDEVEPLCIGGGTITDVGLDCYDLDEIPVRFEAGTPAIAEAIGLGKAVDYLQKIGMEKIEAYEKILGKRMYDGLKQIPKVKVYGPETTNKIAISSFNVGSLSPFEVASKLDNLAKIMVRAGHHCTLPLIKRIAGKYGTVRASAYFYNTPEDIEKLVRKVEELAASST